MKSFTKTIFSTLLAAVVVSSSAFTSAAATPANVTSSSMAQVIGINKIWVSGNVKLILTQGDKESISGTENYDENRTVVHRKGQTLYVNSTSATQVIINITLKDLQRIEAYGQSTVLTTNNFDVKYLQVLLNQNAKARVNAIAGSVYSVIKDNATLRMSGVAKEHTMLASDIKNVKLVDFVCLKNNKLPLADSIRLAGLGK